MAGFTNNFSGDRVGIRTIFAFLALLGLLLHGAMGHGGVVRVGIYENSPKVFTNEWGNPAGIFVDVLEYIATQEGWELDFHFVRWAEGLEMLERGDLDLMPDVARTSERELIFSFHDEPVLSSWFQVYASRGSGVRTILDLTGKRVVVLERSVQQTAFSQLVEGFGISIQLISRPDYEACFEAVQNGVADAAVTNSFFGLENADRFGLVDTAIIFHPSTLHFAAPAEGHQHLLEAIDRHMVDLKGDMQSIYYQSLGRWTRGGVEFTLPEWVKVSGVFILLALALSLTGSFWLKREVDLRTAELREANREMERRIERRTSELALAMERAREADQVKSAFLATMSHELRTPLNSIIGFTGILLQGLPGPLNGEQEKQLRMVQTSARHLLDLINDILDISKIEAGQLDLSIGETDLAASLDKVVAMIRPMAEKKNLEVQMEIEEGLTPVQTDQRRIEQILLNLAINAVKFTDHGRVALSCHMDGDHFVFKVSDTGIGISSDELPRLFSPFRQIDSGLARMHEGTGLGLSISRKLAHLLGGEITVESEPGSGSTFTVRLPSGGGPST